RHLNCPPPRRSSDLPPPLKLRAWAAPPTPSPLNCGRGRGRPLLPSLPPGRPPHPCPASRVGELRENCGRGRSRWGAAHRVMPAARRAAPRRAITSHSLPRGARDRRKGRYAPPFVGLGAEGRVECDIASAEAALPRPRPGGGAAAAGALAPAHLRSPPLARPPPREVRQRRDGGGGEGDPGERNDEAGEDVGRVVHAEVDAAGADRQDDEGCDDPRRGPQPR